MNQITSPAGKPPFVGTYPQALLAPRKHTVIFLLICCAVTAVSAMNAAGNAHPGTSPHSQNEMMQVYLFMIGMQCLWVRFISKGMKRCERSIFEFLATKNYGPAALAKDILFGALAFLTIYFISNGLGNLIHHDPSASAPLLPALPNGPLAVTVWIALSLSAGICEEIVFRGYLQRQLSALTGNLALAIVLQAVIFGVAHAYEGVAAMFDITLHGLILGLLAAWRGNIRAGMIEHAAWDIIAGLGIMQI